MPRVCIDPGHNGTGADTGAQGHGLLEQDLTLDIAQRLKPLLEKNGFEVVMTRDGSVVNGPHNTLTQSLQSRCNIANNAGVELFVSIHVNAGGGTGSEVYALPGGKAYVAAQLMLKNLISACQWTNRGVKFTRYYVLLHTNMPAVLTENGFIDDASDARLLADAGFRQRIAVAHAKGICEYFGVNYRENNSSNLEVERMFESLIVYIGYPEGSIVPRLQTHLKAPAIMLQDLTLETVKAVRKVYGVGYSAKDYVVEGYTIPLFKLLTGSDADKTAQAVIDFVNGK
ncbi:hypothetical protein JCM15765_02370 [Paradesulfitobacterium aromaticivorans]